MASARSTSAAHCGTNSSDDADLSARATARRIPAFLEALDLHDVTLVGNDTGGGLCLAALGSGHPGVEHGGCS
jgi:pimeloyl-ACP methyl ester carboxylesterase